MFDLRSTRAFKFWERYEHHLGLGALAVGFFFDLIVADRPDSVFNNLLLLSYLCIAGTLIIILNLRETWAAQREHKPEPFFFLLAMQFCFGGLASNLLVLYGRSGTLVGSAIFLALLVALIVGNEYLRSRYAKLTFNIGTYYFLLLSYCVIAVPTFIFHSIGPWVFVGSGVISLLCIGIFLTVLFFTVLRGRDTASLARVSGIIGGIFVVFNLLYFLNVIPPVPLSLKSVGVYHSVLKKSDGGYTVLFEKRRWWEVWRETSGVYTTPRGGTASCFSSVFAPAELTAPIYHRWEKKNKDTGEWETQSRVSFGIAGGRDEGYRGYTTKGALVAGDWRCSVETAQGQLIGRVPFSVVETSATPVLSQKAL